MPRIGLLALGCSRSLATAPASARDAAVPAAGRRRGRRSTTSSPASRRTGRGRCSSGRSRVAGTEGTGGTVVSARSAASCSSRSGRRDMSRRRSRTARAAGTSAATTAACSACAPTAASTRRSPSRRPGRPVSSAGALADGRTLWLGGYFGPSAVEPARIAAGRARATCSPGRGWRARCTGGDLVVAGRTVTCAGSTFRGRRDRLRRAHGRGAGVRRAVVSGRMLCADGALYGGFSSRRAARHVHARERWRTSAQRDVPGSRSRGGRVYATRASRRRRGSTGRRSSRVSTSRPARRPRSSTPLTTRGSIALSADGADGLRRARARPRAGRARAGSRSRPATARCSAGRRAADEPAEVDAVARLGRRCSVFARQRRVRCTRAAGAGLALVDETGFLTPWVDRRGAGWPDDDRRWRRRARHVYVARVAVVDRAGRRRHGAVAGHADGGGATLTLSPDERTCTCTRSRRHGVRGRVARCAPPTGALRRGRLPSTGGSVETTVFSRDGRTLYLEGTFTARQRHAARRARGGRRRLGRRAGRSAAADGAGRQQMRVSPDGGTL